MSRKEYSYAKEGNYSYFGEYEGGVVEGIGTGVDWNKLSRYISPLETALLSGSSTYISDIFTSVEGIPIYAMDGTVSAPGYGWQNERTTVRYRIGSNNIGESIAGVLKYDWNATRMKLASGFSLDITDLTATRVVFAGTGGRLTDDAGLTYASGTDTLTTGILNLSATANQLVLQSAGVTGTITWTPATSAKTLTLQNLTGYAMLQDTAPFTNYYIPFTFNGVMTSSANFTYNGTLFHVGDGSSYFDMNAGQQVFSIADRTTGVTSISWVVGAQTGFAASVEYNQYSLSFTGTISHETGDIAEQRTITFAGPSHAFAGASTITDLINFEVTEAGVGTNGTATNSYITRLKANNTRLDPQLVLLQNSTGDSALRFTLGTTISYIMGIDNSVAGDPFKIATAASGTAKLGTSDLWTMTSAGLMTPLALALANTTNAQISADTDNYAIGAASSFRLSTDAQRNLTGLTGGADGKILKITNVGSFNLVLKNDVTSTAANRFLFSTGTDLVLAPANSILLQYDSTSSRWRDAA